MLTYGAKVVIPMEVGEMSWRTKYSLSQEDNEERLREERDLLDETRETVALTELPSVVEPHCEGRGGTYTF
ncbi:hypothetical protein A2U01_0020960 [Trifolium medium]|uniref:Uncharacterized protein n=1 Tax=Trifolium medium TaxID=97028 RepID=A0A392NLG9_9FABA|nr:hypothetical protein [Trifolium medium]